MKPKAYAIANEIRMKRSQFSGAFIICEGATYSRLLRRFVDQATCQLVVAHDKAIALDAIRILDEGGVLGCVAVVDADFDRQNNVLYGSQNVIATPVHDFDVMLFLSPALDKLLDEYGSTGKCDALEKLHQRPIRDVILSAAVEIGALRIVSERRGLSLDFDSLRFGDFLDCPTLTVNRTELITAIRNSSRRHDLGASDIQKWCDGVRACSYPTHDMSNGHDVTKILATGLRKAIGNLNQSVATQEWVETQLRIAYESLWFRNDPLHQSLTAWERLNPHYVILRRK